MVGSFTLGTVGTPKSENIPRSEAIKWRVMVTLRWIEVIFDTISPAKEIVVNLARKDLFESLVTREAEDTGVTVMGSKRQAHQIDLWKVGDNLENSFVGQVVERPAGRRGSLIDGQVCHCCCFCSKLGTEMNR